MNLTEFRAETFWIVVRWKTKFETEVMKRKGIPGHSLHFLLLKLVQCFRDNWLCGHTLRHPNYPMQKDEGLLACCQRQLQPKRPHR